MYKTIIIASSLAVISCKDCQIKPNTDERIRPRNMEWGEHYYDLNKNVNTLENTFDLSRMEKLFKSNYDQKIPYYLWDMTSIRACNIMFSGMVYCVSEPTFQGSFNSDIFVYEFIIFDNSTKKEKTSFSLMFNNDRQLISVAIRGDKIGSTKQHFVKPYTINPSIQLAATTRLAVRKAIKGDNHEDEWYNLLPNFIEKFIIAVDNNIIRKEENESQ